MRINYRLIILPLVLILLIQCSEHVHNSHDCMVKCFANHLSSRLDTLPERVYVLDSCLTLSSQIPGPYGKLQNELVKYNLSFDRLEELPVRKLSEINSKFDFTTDQERVSRIVEGDSLRKIVRGYYIFSLPEFDWVIQYFVPLVSRDQKHLVLVTHFYQGLSEPTYELDVYLIENCQLKKQSIGN